MRGFVISTFKPYLKLEPRRTQQARELTQRTGRNWRRTMVTVNLNLNTNSTATTDFETMANNLFRDGTAQQIQAALSSGLSALCSDSDLSTTSSQTCSTAPSSRRSSNQSNRSSNFEPTTTKQQPRPRRASLLSFGRVEVIEVDQILGDNPAANGPPISAGWNVLSRRTIELDTFDAQRQVDRRTRSELLLSRRERHSRYVLLANTEGRVGCEMFRVIPSHITTTFFFSAFFVLVYLPEIYELHLPVELEFVTNDASLNRTLILMTMKTPKVTTWHRVVLPMMKTVSTGVLTTKSTTTIAETISPPPPCWRWPWRG